MRDESFLTVFVSGVVSRIIYYIKVMQAFPKRMCTTLKKRKTPLISLISQIKVIAIEYRMTIF